MTAVDDLTAVLEVAMLTEDRSDREHDAMLRVAASVDRKLNALVVTNKRQGRASHLYRDVAYSRDGDPRTKADLLDKLDKQAERWERWHA